MFALFTLRNELISTSSVPSCIYFFHARRRDRDLSLAATIYMH